MFFMNFLVHSAKLVYNQPICVITISDNNRTFAA